ncbi:hypothetical protein [Xenorhabdus nematophila]|nr:hypothetical protein [Xenorhabdus nematophila]
MNAKKPLDKIKIAFTLLAKAWKVLFFSGVYATVNCRTDKEKKELRDFLDAIARPD